MLLLQIILRCLHGNTDTQVYSWVLGGKHKSDMEGEQLKTKQLRLHSLSHSYPVSLRSCLFTITNSRAYPGCLLCSLESTFNIRFPCIVFAWGGRAVAEINFSLWNVFCHLTKSWEYLWDTIIISSCIFYPLASNMILYILIKLSK